MSTQLLESFPETSAEAWRKQIEKDLKGQSPESKAWSPDGHLKIDPYVHSEDMPEEMAPLRNFGQWLIGERFEVSDPAECNTAILEALTGGVESIHLTVPGNTNWEILLSQVELPLLHVGIRFTSDEVRELKGFLSYAGRQAVLNDLHLTVDGPVIADQSNRRYATAPSWEKGIIDGLSDTLYSAIVDSQGDPANLSKRDLRLSIGENYLLEIARLRACRILWQNISTAIGFKLSSRFAIEAVTESGASNDPYTHMIRSAFMGTAAVLGGADRVYIIPASGKADSAGFHRHVARNISHLLRYESKFTEIPDPVAGAYYIEKITKSLVDQTWNSLIPALEKAAG